MTTRDDSKRLHERIVAQDLRRTSVTVAAGAVIMVVTGLTVPYLFGGSKVTGAPDLLGRIGFVAGLTFLIIAALFLAASFLLDRRSRR